MELDKARLVEKATSLVERLEGETYIDWICIAHEIQDLTNQYGLKFTLRVVIEPYREIEDDDIVRVSYHE